MPGIIEIQVKTLPSFVPWIAFLNANRLDKNNTPSAVKIDFSQAKFFNPAHVVSLACLIEEYYLNGAAIKFKKCDNSAMKYLHKLNFINYWKKDFDRSKYRISTLETALSLWKLNDEMIHSYVVNAQRYFQQNFFSGKDLQPLNTALAEIFNNIIDHAQAESGGYAFTQYYPNKERIVISVCDFGRGIPFTINEYLQREENRTISNDKALQLAFKKGFSTKSVPTNRGFGLDNVLSLTKSLKSRFLFISNDAYVEQQKSGKFVKSLRRGHFPGTQIVIEIDTRYLNMIEVEELMNEEFYL